MEEHVNMQQSNLLAKILQEMRRSEQCMEDRPRKMEDVQRSQEVALEKALKRARHKKSYIFKKRGYQAQSEFNKHVRACIEQAVEAVACRPMDESTSIGQSQGST